MRRDTYIRMMDFWRNHSLMLRLLSFSNKAITLSIYIAYPCLLAYLALTAPIVITARATLVPFAGLIAVSALRSIVNAPRPYQVFQTQPAIPKDTLGKSLPSKHTFCIFIIGIAFLASLPSPAAGIIVLAMGIALGAIRVASGVHFARDVIAGAAMAILFGLIGFYWM